MRGEPLRERWRVRRAEKRDAPRLLRLMRELARFERYLDAFAVTERDLHERAFGRHPQCGILVAEDAGAPSGDPVGYAVTFETRFTYDLKPTITLKELYVGEEARGRGIGRALLRAVAANAVAAGAGRLEWRVLAGNRRAEAFYRSLGGRRVRKWIPYVMEERAMRRLLLPYSAGEEGSSNSSPPSAGERSGEGACPAERR